MQGRIAWKPWTQACLAWGGPHLRVGQAEQQVVLELLDFLLVALHLAHQRHALLLQLRFLLLTALQALSKRCQTYLQSARSADKDHTAHCHVELSHLTLPLSELMMAGFPNHAVERAVRSSSTEDMANGPAACLQNELDQQLVLQAGLGDGEVDDGDARAQLGREVRVGQPRGAEQAERLRVVHLPPAQQECV